MCRIKIKKYEWVNINIGFSILSSMVAEVNKENLFEVMMEYHYQNLLACLPHLSEKGQILDAEGKPLLEGKSEVPYYKGALILYDGETILKKASDMILRKRNGVRPTEEIGTRSDLIGRLQQEPDQDCVYLFNTHNSRITPIKGELKNHHQEIKDLEDLLETHLPKDFLSKTEEIEVYNAGNKTAIAMIAAKVLPEIRSIIVKRSAYGDLGMGKIAEFGEDGYIRREFFFEYAPDHQGPFVDEEKKIVGIMREYNPMSKELASEKYISFENGAVQYHK